MPHHVYANNQEIASKSSKGRSESIMQDVCISPGPPPPPGGLPIPYTNICKNKKLVKTSKTVKLKGEGGALENKSKFSKSKGDKTATEPLKKGIISANIEGPCYFIIWSMNVKFESKGVARHDDMITHNHSNPPNTPPIYYVSRHNLPSDCKSDYRRMEARCKPEDEDERKRRNRKRRKKRDKPDSNNGWLEHCGPLMVKPNVAEFEEWAEKYTDLDQILEDTVDILKTEVITRLEQEIVEFGLKKAAKFAARRGLTGWIPFVGWAISAADAIYTGYEVITTVNAMKDELGNIKQLVTDLKEKSGKLRQMFDKYASEIKDFKNLSAKRQKEIVKDVMAETQAAYGAVNPCMRARKCFLVPFNKTNNAASTTAGKGCCPGQTGHHLMPDAMFRDSSSAKRNAAFESWKKTYKGSKPLDELKMGDMSRDKLPKRKCWEGYTEGGAPTICLEGGASSGSHGAIHTATAAFVKPFQAKNGMDYKTARNGVTTMVSAAYGCDKDCLDAQMDSYYKDVHKCGPLNKADVTAHTGQSGGSPADDVGVRGD